MKAFLMRLGLLALAAGFASRPLAGADDSPKTEDAKGPHAGEIRRLKELQGWRKGAVQWMTTDFQQFGDFSKSDLRLLATEFQAHVDLFQKAIDAYRRDDVETARALGKDSEKTKESRDWRKRLDARRQQWENWPTEQWVEDVTTKWGGARTKAFGVEWVQSKRRATAAWGRYAESIGPGVEREKLTALEDAAHLAEAEVRSTEERWRVRQTIDDRLWDKTVTSKELEKKIREFEQFGDKTIAIIRQRADAERQLRAWQRERQHAERDLDETFRTTRDQQLEKKPRNK